MMYLLNLVFALGDFVSLNLVFLKAAYKCHADPLQISYIWIS